MKKLLASIFTLTLMSGYAQTNREIKDIAIYLQDNVEILDFAGPMEVFIIAGYNVYTVADTSEPLKAMHTLTITPDYGLEDAPEPDILVFVGGGNVEDAKAPRMIEWTRRMTSTAEIAFSVCTGAYFLAEAGLLDDLMATTYHLSIPRLREEFPKVDVKENVCFVDNGKVITTAGISAGIDGALHLVAKLKGTKYAQYVANAMEYDKWVSNEGLVLVKTLENEIVSQGFEKAINSKEGKALYNGELLDLAERLEQMGALANAEKCIAYAISRMDSPDITTYNYLRNIRNKQGKEVPPTSEEFNNVLKTEGVKAAERLNVKVSKKFKDWRYIDSDKIIRDAYLDHYSKGNLKTAKEWLAMLYRILPKDPYVAFVMGLYEERSNDLKKAETFYKESLRLNPNFHMAQEKLDALVGKF